MANVCTENTIFLVVIKPAAENVFEEKQDIIISSKS